MEAQKNMKPVRNYAWGPCARHNFLYIRGWMQMVIGIKGFILLKQIIQWNLIPVMVILYNCYTMHNNTHSVHKHLLKMWRARLLRLWPSCCVSPPPLSEANCQPLPPPGGPGPPFFQDGSFFPRIQTHPLPIVCYRPSSHSFLVSLSLYLKKMFKWKTIIYLCL